MVTPPGPWTIFDKSISAVCAIYASCAGTAAHRHNNRIMNKSISEQLSVNNCSLTGKLVVIL